jgi:hypothetical protein
MQDSSKNDLGSLIDEFDRDRKTADSSRSINAPTAEIRRILVAGVSLLATIGALAYLATHFTGGPPDGGELSRTRVAMDAETGDVIQKLRINDGDTMPWPNPRTGRRTMYPPETCYWTRDGAVKPEPTYVILNEMLGIEGPTICPDCGRRVVYHNPLPPTDLLLEALQDARERGQR